MAVDTHALTSVDEVLSYLGKEPTRNALSVYCSQGDATAATVEITDTTIVLIITGGDEEGPNTLTFGDANKNTLSELVVAINALTGWTANRIYHSDAESTDLIVTGALPCLGSANEIALKIRDNYLIERLIDRATDFIERYCNRKFVTRTYTNEIYYGTGTNRLLLDQYPIIRILRIGIGRANAFSILNTSTDANFATVEVTSTVMRLIVDGGANADDSSITLADHSNIDALIAAIVALGKGWSCSTLATDTATRDADELLPQSSMFVDATKRAYCETADDYMTDYRVISPAEGRNYGVIQKAGIFVSSTEYFVSYVAGFATVPYALEDACVRLVKFKHDESTKDLTLASEKIGNVYAYATGDLEKALPASLISELELFRKREF